MSCLECHDFMDGYNRGKREGVIEELEDLERQIIEKRQLIKRDTVIFTDIVWTKINAYNDILLLIKKREYELREENNDKSRSH